MKIKLSLIALTLTFSTVSFGLNFPIDNEIIGHATATENPDDYILSDKYIVPTEYNIQIKPDFGTLKIEGTVDITVTVKEITKQIVLHRGKDVIFDKDDIVVKQKDGDNQDLEVKATAVDYDDKNNFCTITLESDLKAAEAIITIKYTATIGTKNKGFYLAKYIDEEGKDKQFGTTQFESTSARDAFPCFDQPNLKAYFTIKINRPKGYNSASNMKLDGVPVVDPTDNTREIDTFKKTSERMPTYLIAFVVSELTATGTDADMYRVYGLPHLIADGRGKYGVENGEKIIDAMKKFVDVDYTLEKLDQVAIPDDYFSAGAMENWGLVTYKQKYLLQKDGVTTASEKQNVLSIIAHEFAHQWFGNLVTPKWWNSLWLSEGFATYFEHYATEVVDSSMKMMDQFITLTNQVALEADASDSTRAMHADVYTPEDISKFFDRIAYQKSGAVIRMMEHIVTTDIFKLGLTKYLDAKKADGTVEPSDLWKGIQEAVDTLTEEKKKEYALDTKTIAEIMDTWNENVGYPVVTATRDENGVISLSQDRFLYSKKESGESTIWQIPITYTTEKLLEFTTFNTDFWLDANTGTTEITVPLEEWFILNKQQVGFYRVNYDEDTWNLIIDYINTEENYKNIHVLNRAQLIDDSFNLARAGRIKYDIPLRLSNYLAKETEYIPLATFLKSINFFSNYLSSTDHYGNLKAYAIASLQAAFDDLKIEDTTEHIKKLNRAQIINTMCKFEEENCTKQIHEKILALATESKSPVPDLQTSYYCGGMRSADDDSATKFKYMLARYQNTDVEYLEKERIISGIGCSLNEVYLMNLLNIVIGKNPEDYKDFVIDDRDKRTAFTAVYTSSELGLKTALNFISENIKDVETAFAGDTDILSSIIRGIAARTSVEDHKNILSGIATENADLKAVIAEAVTTITTNGKWRDENLGDVHTWLSDTYGSAGFVTVSITLLLSMLVVLNVF